MVQKPTKKQVREGRRRREKQLDRWLSILLVVAPLVPFVQVVPWGLLSLGLATVFLIRLYWIAELTETDTTLEKAVGTWVICVFVVAIAFQFLPQKWREEQSAVLSGVLHPLRPGWGKDNPPNTTNDIEAGQSNVMLSVDLPPAQQNQDFLKLYHYARLKIEKGDTELLFTTTIRDREGNVIVDIDKNAWSLPLPQYVLDKNYTQDTLEVKDRRGHVVLQVRLLPDRVQLQAEWNDEYGRGMRMIQSPKGGISFVKWDSLQEAERQDRDETQIKPWFRYPSHDRWAEWLPPQKMELLPEANDETEDVKQPKGAEASKAPPFNVIPGAAFMSTNFNTGFYWLVREYAHNMTPANIIAFYTVANLKSTPSMISRLYLEVTGANHKWYTLRTLEPHTGRLIAATLDQPTDITEITVPAGFLLDKIENRALASGESVQGWIVCEYPPSYVPTTPDKLRLRMVIVNTVNEQTVSSSKGSSSRGNAIASVWQAKKVPMDVSNYRIVR